MKGVFFNSDIGKKESGIRNSCQNPKKPNCNKPEVGVK